jgi:putative hydrolase
MELWQRFSPRARRAVVLAFQEASRAETKMIGSDHLLFGLLEIGDCGAIDALKSIGVWPAELAAQIRLQFPRGSEAQEPWKEIAFTPEAQRALQIAYAQARELRADHVGTEHLLLGLAHQGSPLLALHRVEVARVRAAIAERQPAPSDQPAPHDEAEKPGVYDFHTHTFLSDGVLSPIELIRRAIVNGYRAIGIADHVGAATMERVIQELARDCDLAAKHWNFEAFPGVELTHVPAASIAELAAQAREMGASHVVVHGETLVEPVEPGTNLAAVSCADVDILAHPGMLTEEEALLAAANDVFIELTSKEGHSLSNGHVFRIASGSAMCLVNSDTHLPDHILTPDFARSVALGAGVPPELLDRVLRQNPENLLDRLRARRGDDNAPQ